MYVASAKEREVTLVDEINSGGKFLAIQLYKESHCFNSENSAVL